MKKIVLAGFLIIFSFEIFYSWNNQIAYYPIVPRLFSRDPGQNGLGGPAPWISSKIRFENYNWGYNELGKWLEKELSGKMPAITFDLKYQFLEDLRVKALKTGQRQGSELYPALLIYEGNFDGGAKLWILDRLHFYHAWPIISLETYYQYLQENGFDYYNRAGFKNYYFILQTNAVPSSAAKALMRGMPVGIYNQRGDRAFEIYKF